MTKVMRVEAVADHRRDRLSRTTESKHFMWIEELGRTDVSARWVGFRNATVVMRINYLDVRPENGQFEVKTDLPGGSFYSATHPSLEDAQRGADEYFESWANMMGLSIRAS